MNQVAVTVHETADDTAFVRFWNEVLAPKFIRFKHILVDGLSHHSEAVFPALPVRHGDQVLDVGCGFGDTALKLAERVGPAGHVVGIDCCDAFLDFARPPQPTKKTVATRELLDECLAGIAARAELQRVEVRLNAPATKPTPMAAPG